MSGEIVWSRWSSGSSSVAGTCEETSCSPRIGPNAAQRVLWCPQLKEYVHILSGFLIPTGGIRFDFHVQVWKPFEEFLKQRRKDIAGHGNWARYFDKTFGARTLAFEQLASVLQSP